MEDERGLKQTRTFGPIIFKKTSRAMSVKIVKNFGAETLKW
jgi:hypothetical protein